MNEETNIELKIGRRIRQLREERNVTLDQLAQKTSLTKGQLSKIENGKVSSPVSTLTRIASAMGVEIAYFFVTNQDDSRASLVKQNERPVVVGRASKVGHTYHSLTENLPFKKAFEPYLMTIEDHNLDPKQNVFKHVGHEFIFILKGAMDYCHGGRIYKLEEGDSFYFDAAIEHGPIRIQSPNVEFLSMISNPAETTPPNIST